MIETVEKKLTDVPEEQKRFFAIKLLEKDDKIQAQMKSVPDVSAEIKQLETAMDDDTESIITNERYTYISYIIKECYTKKEGQKLTTSDKIDKIVTNRWLALPIFAVVMFIVYYVSVTTVGTWATDWANDGVFGDGWHLFTIGTGAYEEAAEPYDDAMNVINAFVEADGDEALAAVIDSESEDYDPAAAVAAVQEFAAGIDASATADYTLEDEETLATEDVTYTGAELAEAVDVYAADGAEAPDPADYGIWVPGVPALLESGLDAIGCADWLKGLILDGIVAGVGAVLGFVPQMLVLFIFLAFLESCGYMARIAFIMDRIFRKFGLSGKSFIPMLIGSGCGVPGIMASRTIENERDRRMTIMTTTFIPCGAKVPFIAMIAGAIFGGSAWVSTSAYFIGMAAIIVSGIMLKKTKMFAGDPAPFVMELPAYHWPTLGNVLRSMWERGWSFIKKAGTIILLSTIFVWFTTYFGWVDGTFRMLDESEIQSSILAAIGGGIAGWGNSYYGGSAKGIVICDYATVAARSDTGHGAAIGAAGDNGKDTEAAVPIGTAGATAEQEDVHVTATGFCGSAIGNGAKDTKVTIQGHSTIWTANIRNSTAIGSKDGNVEVNIKDNVTIDTDNLSANAEPDTSGSSIGGGDICGDSNRNEKQKKNGVCGGGGGFRHRGQHR